MRSARTGPVALSAVRTTPLFVRICPLSLVYYTKGRFFLAGQPLARPCPRGCLPMDRREPITGFDINAGAGLQRQTTCFEITITITAV